MERHEAGLAELAPPNRQDASVGSRSARSSRIASPTRRPVTASRPSSVYTAGFVGVGTHTVEMRVTGTRNPLSTSRRVDLDAVVVLG